MSDPATIKSSSMPVERASAPRPVTQAEIVELIEPAFLAAAPDRWDLVDEAAEAGARPEVLRLLERLPNRRFATPRELWRELPDVPAGG